MNDYPLTYFRKSDGVAFKARSTGFQCFKLFDHENNVEVELSAAKLRRNYRSSKANTTSAFKRSISARRGIKTTSREYYRYLRGETA